MFGANLVEYGRRCGVSLQAVPWKKSGVLDTILSGSIRSCGKRLVQHERKPNPGPTELKCDITHSRVHVCPR